MSGERIFGIDLGTSKACVATMDAQGVPTAIATPSGRKLVPAVLSFHPDGSILVGEDAVPQKLADPQHTPFGLTRLLGLPASAREVVDAASRVPFLLRPGPDDQAMVATRAGDLTVAEVTTFLLEHVRRYAQEATQSDARQALFTMPASASDAQRHALDAAARAAGFEVLGIVPDAVAVATAYGYGRTLAPLLAVVDIGAGKVECSIVQIQGRVPRIVGAAADPMIGGDEIDHRIVDMTCRAFWQVHRVDLRADRLVPLFLRAAAERAKVELSTASSSSITARGIATAPDGQLIDLNLELTRETLGEALADIFQRVVGVAGQALRAAGVEASQCGEVLLVGGPSRLPFLRELVATFFARAPRTDVHPDEGVAVGAAIHAVHGGIPDPAGLPSMSKRVTAQFGSDVQQAKPSEASSFVPSPGRVGRVHTKRMFTAVMNAQAVPSAAETIRSAEVSFSPTQVVRPQVQEVLASRLGLSTVGGFCDEILARDASLPAAKTRVFTTGKDDQRSVRIQVCQGDSRRFAENHALGTLVLDQLPAAPRGTVKIEVTFAVDADGVLRAEARDAATGRAQTVEIRLRD